MQLHEAAEKGSIEHLRLILEQQLPLDEKNERGETALHIATARGHRLFAEKLLEAGANPSIVTNEGSTILHAAAMSGMDSIIEKLCTNSELTDGKRNDDTGKVDDPVSGEDKREKTERSPKKIPSKEWQDIYKKCNNLVLTDSGTDEDDEDRRAYQLPGIEEYLKDLFSTDVKEDKLEKDRMQLQKMLAHLSQGVDVNANLGSRATLLHLTAACRMEDTVRLLLKRKSDANGRMKEGVTPLMMACSGGSLEVARILVEAGANPKDVDNRQRSALHYAVRVNSLQLTRYLLTLGVDPNKEDNRGNTPLHIASIFDADADIITALLDAGAEIRTANNDGLYPFCLTSDPSIFSLLHPQGESQYTNRVRIYYDPIPSPHPFELNLARMSIKDDDSSKKEASQVDNSDKNDAENSASKGEDGVPNAPKPHHKKTKRGGRKHKKKHIEQENKQVQTVRPDKITDLYLRIMTQYPDDMDEKLRDYFMDGRFDEINCSVIDTNRRDKAGLTILHHAVRCCRYMAVERLVVKCKADVNAETYRGVTPVFLAATTGYSDVIRILHENGANLNHAIKCGMTPLHYAVFHKNADSILTLTYLGANINSPDKNGNTPLHYATMTRDSLRIVETLVEKGADPQFINYNGMRPLEMAKRVGDREVVKFLASITEELRGIEITRNFI